MLDVSEAVKQAYINGNAQTEIFLAVTKTDGTTAVYNPTNILSGSVSIVESLCSSEAFDISRVEKNQLTFTLFNITEGLNGLQGGQVVAKQRVTLPDETTVDIPLGTYTIFEAMNDGDYLYKCTCYDTTMYKLDGLIDDWWKAVRFPITLRNLAISMFEYLGCLYDIPAEFNNYDYVVPAMNTVFEGVTGTEVLGYIQEIVGGFFKANRFGVITLRVPVPTASGLYPHIGLYPHTGLYPRRSSSGFGVDGEVGIGDWDYPQIVGDLQIGDYDVKRVTKVQIRGTEDDIGIIAGGGTNTYVIQGNPLLFNLTDATGRQIAENILSAVGQIAYKPFSGKFMAQPYVEVGDMAMIMTLEQKEGVSPIFQRTLSGARLAFDTFQCLGLEEREQVSSVNRKLTTVNQRTHEVINTVDELVSTVTQVENTVNTHTTQISQNANEITLSAKRSGIFNLFVNSDFTNQANHTQGWQWYNSLTGAEYTYDENFIGSSSDYNKIENGNCLRITLDDSTGYAYFYQELNIDSPITENLQVQFTARVITQSENQRIRVWVRALDASGVEIVSQTSGRINFSQTTGCGRVTFNTLKTALAGVTVAKLRIGAYIDNLTTTSVLEVNHFLATFTSATELLPFYSWTNYASKDVISQINIQPSGVKIQGEKIDIWGVTTIHNTDGTGETVLTGSTIRSAQIETGTLRGSSSALTFDMSTQSTEYKIKMTPASFGIWEGSQAVTRYGVRFDDENNNGAVGIKASVFDVRNDYYNLVHNDNGFSIWKLTGSNYEIALQINTDSTAGSVRRFGNSNLHLYIDDSQIAFTNILIGRNLLRASQTGINVIHHASTASWYINGSGYSGTVVWGAFKDINNNTRYIPCLQL